MDGASLMCLTTPSTGAGLGQAAPAAAGHGAHRAAEHPGAAGEPADVAPVGREQPGRQGQGGAAAGDRRGQRSHRRAPGKQSSFQPNLLD